MDRSQVLIDLALQGGGSHGAFTWGVLDRLLEEPWLRIAGISGTSAGAMNAAVLADGWTDGGAEGARPALEKFWQRVSRAAAFSPLQRSCPFRKSYPRVAMMQSTQDGHSNDGTRPLDCAMQWRSLVQ